MNRRGGTRARIDFRDIQHPVDRAGVPRDLPHPPTSGDTPTLHPSCPVHTYQPHHSQPSFLTASSTDAAHSPESH
ncbi:hypothetical protein BaRGS_00000822 [Batillaria attramentaria]|uniref:Uncharacterized protein n=1 Tax=Batillaria attramentaria TaxID=370345 RepID=A0ABD0M811_9CAEN